MNLTNKKAWIIDENGVGKLVSLSSYKSQQPRSTETGNRNALTIIRMEYQGRDCFTIANRDAMPEVNVFFQVCSSLSISVEQVLIGLGLAHEVISIDLLRTCGKAKDMKVVFEKNFEKGD